MLVMLESEMIFMLPSSGIKKTSFEEVVHNRTSISHAPAQATPCTRLLHASENTMLNALPHDGR